MADSALTQLRAQLKAFEAAFLGEHSRKPSPADIDARPEMGG
jgi:hypothetical protein